MNWSSQQQEIFDFFANGHGHLVVRARAGTGKTTTIVEAIKYAPETKILLCAFNKRIADELTLRLSSVNPNAQAKTLHSVGFSAVRRAKSNVRVVNGNRASDLALEVCGSATPDPILKLVANLHTKGREIAPHAKFFGDLTDLLYTFECEPSEEWAAAGYDAAYVERSALKAMELASKVHRNEIDFADMIFLPVRNGWLTKQFDLVVVDEAQDMTVAQLEIARGICRGRLVVVGDNCQAIYGFRGADSESLDRLKTELNAVELGLTTTYRCGKSIVELAARLVPDFQAGEKNSDGEILNLPMAKLTESLENGDFLLSRVNAPLVSTALKLLKGGKRARIAGRDIGAGIKALVNKLAKGRAANSIPEFLDRVTAWQARETERMQRANRPERAAEIADKAEMIVSLCEEAKSVADVTNRIDVLFTDDGLGAMGVITCSSVHRSKGLEANRVFILQDTLKAHSQEELNIQYVAITRAKNTLVWVK